MPADDPTPRDPASTPAGSNELPCPSCGQTNPREAAFCHHCGAALKARCPHCQAQLEAGASHCPSCGEHVGDFAAAMELVREIKQRFSREDHVGVLELARRGLAEHQSLQGELQAFQQQAMEVIEDRKQEIGDKLEAVDQALARTRYDQAREPLDEARRLLDAEPGAEELRGAVDDATGRVEAMAASHRDGLMRVQTLRGEQRLRAAGDAARGLAERFNWDQGLAAQLEELEAQLAEADEIEGLTRAAVKRHDFREAETLLEQLRAIEPTHPAMQDLQARVRMQRRSYDKGVEQIDKATRRGAFDRAEEIADGLASRYPDDPELASLRARLTRRRDAAGKYAEAQGNESAATITAARRAWQAVTRDAPDDPAARSALADLDNRWARYRRRRVKLTALLIGAAVVVVTLAGGSWWWWASQSGRLDAAREAVAAGRYDEARALLEGVYLSAEAAELRATASRAIQIRRLEPVVMALARSQSRAAEANADASAPRLHAWAARIEEAGQDAFDDKRWDDAFAQYQVAGKLYDAAYYKSAALQAGLDPADTGDPALDARLATAGTDAADAETVLAAWRDAAASVGVTP